MRSVFVTSAVLGLVGLAVVLLLGGSLPAALVVGVVMAGAPAAVAAFRNTAAYAERSEVEPSERARQLNRPGRPSARKPRSARAPSSG